jgi:hypothetical protein
MRTATMMLLTSLPLTVQLLSQSPPDFSGTWRLDPLRSDATAYGNTPGPVTVKITQTRDEIRIATTTSRGRTETSFVFVTPEAPPLAGSPNARWQGEALVTNAIHDIRGQSVAVQQSRRLSADGKEMIVESVVNVQHGYSARGAQTYGASTDIFVRVN